MHIVEQMFVQRHSIAKLQGDWCTKTFNFNIQGKQSNNSDFYIFEHKFQLNPCWSEFSMKQYQRILSAMLLFPPRCFILVSCNLVGTGQPITSTFMITQTALCPLLNPSFLHSPPFFSLPSSNDSCLRNMLKNRVSLYIYYAFNLKSGLWHFLNRFLPLKRDLLCSSEFSFCIFIFMTFDDAWDWETESPEDEKWNKIMIRTCTEN